MTLAKNKFDLKKKENVKRLSLEQRQYSKKLYTFQMKMVIFNRDCLKINPGSTACSFAKKNKNNKEA